MLQVINISICLAIYLLTLLSVFAQGEKTGASPAWEKGASNAKFVIEVFNDYQCPTCASFNEQLKIIYKKHPDDIRLIFRHFPLTNMHLNAMLAAQATEAAGKQNKFWEMSELLLEGQQKWSYQKEPEKMFISYAKQIGLNAEDFKKDLNSLDIKERINLDIERAKSLNLNSTPSVLVNGKILTFIELSDLEELLFSKEIK